MTDTPQTPSPDETGLGGPGYSTEPVGGGAESVPDPQPPADPDQLGGPDTVASNDELSSGEVER